MIDLHSHTTASDGSLRPHELIELACQTGLSALAITDHDTFAGYEAARDHAAQSGLRLVQGVELSTRLAVEGYPAGRAIHLLAYFPVEAPSAQFQEWLQVLRDSRRDRNRRMLERLQRMGVDIDYEDLRAAAPHMIGRPHFAEVLMRKGYAGSYKEAFQRYLAEGSAAYVQRAEPPTTEAIAMVREAGGVTSLAHPVRVPADGPDGLEGIARELAEAGLTALETIHSDHTVDLREQYRDLARKYGLLESGGSDFHGAPKPDVRLGFGRNGNVQVPDEYLERLQAAAERNAGARSTQSGE